MTKFPPPRPNTADQACRDLIAFLTLARDEPISAKAYQDCLKLRLSIIVCHFDRGATVVAGKPIFYFELQKRLMRHLSAFRAGQLVNA
jgi:hypothetical protein